MGCLWFYLPSLQQSCPESNKLIFQLLSEEEEKSFPILSGGNEESHSFMHPDKVSIHCPPLEKAAALDPRSTLASQHAVFLLPSVTNFSFPP